MKTDRAQHTTSLCDMAVQFARSLDVSVRLIQQLETTLLEETRAIEIRNTDALLHSVSNKRDLVAQIEAETLSQKRIVEGQQQSFTPAGMTKFFAMLGNDLPLLSLWSALRDASSRCDRMNRANSRLIERDRKRIATALRILNGGDDGAAATYNLQGRAEAAELPSRTIIQA